MSSADSRELVPLGQGIYTVPEVCRILRPHMTSRKIHYWLKGDLLGAPIRPGSRGIPVLLSFEQVLRIKTLQRIRDALNFSLPKARIALEWIATNLVAPDANWQDLHFFRSQERIGVGSVDRTEFIEVGTAQGVMPITDDLVQFLTAYMREARTEFESRTISIEGFSEVHSNAKVMGGATIIVGTRIETEFVANLAQELSLPEIQKLFPRVESSALAEAIEFERTAA
jgi:uncharacterized protein (DUF433 family)